MDILPAAEVLVSLHAASNPEMPILMETEAAEAQHTAHTSNETLAGDENIVIATVQGLEAQQILLAKSLSAADEQITTYAGADPGSHASIIEIELVNEHLLQEPVSQEASTPALFNSASNSLETPQQDNSSARSTSSPGEVLPEDKPVLSIEPPAAQDLEAGIGASEASPADSREPVESADTDCIRVSRFPSAGTFSLPEAVPTDQSFATPNSDSLPASVIGEPITDLTNDDMPQTRSSKKSLVVTLKYGPGQTPLNAGASPDSSATLDLAETPPAEDSMKTRNSRASRKTSVKTKTPPAQRQSPSNKENFSPGLYARERNVRRAATKRFREPVTPGKARTPQPETERNVALLEPNPETKQKKRSIPVFKDPEPKRRKGNDGSSKPAPRRNTVAIGQTFPVPVPVPDPTEVRPRRDVEHDANFIEQMQQVLEVRSKAKRGDMGKRQAGRILDLLNIAEYPREDEALFLTREEAVEQMAPGNFWTNIIITTGQQNLPLQSVEEFLGEYYDDDARVWIQDPEVKPSRKTPITRRVRIGSVKERFAAGATDKPWNLLELATHADDGLRPTFLNNEDCRLLTKLKIPDDHSGPEARRRQYAPGYKEVEKWALVAQSGALTEPHQDSHGYSTFITINTGLVGFGWLSDPSEQERAAWRQDPSTFRNGNWRYIVLKPGQTVYFPAGTVHFVFRHPSVGNTLAFGGHILRCSNIVHWVKTLIEERDQKDVTNEDLTSSATGYLDRVQKFVNQAKVNGTEDKWGGEDNIEEFLRLKEQFLSKRQK